MSKYRPPFHMTDRITNLTADICEQLGQIKILSNGKFSSYLRKENRIRTIHSSLAIEHNSLSLEQVTAIIDGKRILGNPVEIKEVKNAYTTYEMMLTLDPFSVDDLLKAHETMMKELISENGRFRSGGVGVFNGKALVHMAPPANMVADGNGRMGRMWHSLLLGRWNEIFYWLPVEELIRSRQEEYYNALGKSDRDADSSAFVEFLLQVILDTLQNTTVVGNDEVEEQKDPLVDTLREAIGKDTLSATEIMKRLGLSHRPTFRQNYLNPALSHGVIEMTIPDKPNSRNQKYRLKK